MDINKLKENVEFRDEFLIFFYELCKMGVVKFDLSNEKHVNLLADMLEMSFKLITKASITDGCVKATEIKNNAIAFSLIAKYLVENAIPKES